MSARIEISGTEGNVTCSVCAEVIPDGRPGLNFWVYHRAALICFRCVDVMADIVAEQRTRAEVKRRARPMHGGRS